MNCRLATCLVALSFATLLSSCGGGGGDSGPPPPPPTFTIGGTVTGLAGTGLTLANNGALVTVDANGVFTFPVRVPQGSAYSVVAQTTPVSPWQSCAVTNGTGTVGSAAVTNITVECNTSRFTLLGVVSGLQGAGLTLQVNGGAPIPVTTPVVNFPGSLPSGTNYTVTVQDQPIGPGQDCVVTNGTGQVAGGDISNIAIDCTVLRFSALVRNIAAQDLVWNHMTNELYASVLTTATTGPAILVIDARTGEVKRTVPTAQLARPMVMAGNGVYLYAAMGDTGTIQRFALPALTPNLDFNIGLDSGGVALRPADIQVHPNDVGTIAVTREYTQSFPSDFGLAIYDNGLMRAGTLGDAQPVSGAGTHFEGAFWNSAGTEIYSYDTRTSSGCFWKIAVSAAGVTGRTCLPDNGTRAYAGEFSFGQPFVYSNYQRIEGRMYSAAGPVSGIDGNNQIGAFATRGQGIAVDAGHNKVFFASGESVEPLTFESFNQTRMTPITTNTVAGASGNVRKLVRWGEYGLAAITGTQLVLASGTFVSDPVPNMLGPSGATLVDFSGITGAHSYRALAVPANDAVWDASRSRVLATVSGTDARYGNSVVSIELNTNRVVTAAAVGSEPTWVTLSDDASKIFVSHRMTSAVGRVSSSPMQLDQLIWLQGSDLGPRYPIAAVPQPGVVPENFAYAAQHPIVGGSYVGMGSIAGLLPDLYPPGSGSLAFLNGMTLFGHDPFTSSLTLHQIGVTPMGLVPIASYDNIFAGGNERITIAGGLLYSDGGFAMNPISRTIVHSYSANEFGSNLIFRANPARNRGYLAYTGTFGAGVLAVFRLSDEVLLQRVELPPTVGTPKSLASVEASGVAIATTSGHLVIVEGPDL